jgi:hypothetical protein
MRRKAQRGAVTVEWALVYGAVLMPVTFGIIFLAQLLWIWHSVVDFTRDGARYASTHCWNGSGQNVVDYMKSHVPLMVDMDQFQAGQAEIVVSYFSRNPDTGQLEEFACDNSECTTGCVPDAVSVIVRGYEFRRFVTYLGLPPVPVPEFRTSLPMESAGCDPATGECLP